MEPKQPRGSNYYNFSDIGGHARVHAGDTYEVHTSPFTSLQQCHQAFKVCNYDSFKRVNILPAPNTCGWVLRNRKFQDWRQSKHNDLLWLSANPGCGKSVFCRGVIDGDLLRSSNSSTKNSPRCLHFFFKANSQQNRLKTALCSLNHQLYRDQWLLNTLLPAWKAHGYSLLEDERELWTLLLRAAGQSTRPIVCILDALDECTPQDAKMLVDWMCEFYNATADESARRWGESTLKFIVTSRPYDVIALPFRRVPQVRLRGEDEDASIRQEIDEVIQARVSDLAYDLRVSRPCESRIRRYLQAKNNRTYLWVNLAIEDIHQQLLDCPDPEYLNIETLEIPESVEEQYERLLGRIKDQNRARLLLAIILGAKRPLDVFEMAGALSIALGLGRSNRIEPYHLRRRLPEWCGLFVFVDSSQRLILIHETAKEFLMARSETDIIGNHIWKSSITAASVDLKLANICVETILGGLHTSLEGVRERHGLSHVWTVLPEHPDNPHSDLLLTPSRHHRFSHKTCEVCKKLSGLDNYAVENWLEHVQKAPIDTDRVLERNIYHLYNTRSGSFQSWFFRTEAMSTFWPFDLALSVHGAADYVPETSDRRPDDLGHLFYDTDSDQEAESSDVPTGAIRIALLPIIVQCGHFFVMERLYSRISGGLNVPAANGYTALALAAYKSYPGTFHWLLQQGAKVDARGSHSAPTALHAAILKGNINFAHVLLSVGADVDATYLHLGNDESAISLAAGRGHPEILEMLIKHRPRRSTIGAALQIAAERDVSMLRCLVNAGIDPDTRDEQGQLALLTVLRDRVRPKKHVEMLLEAGADINAQEPDGSTALHVCVLRDLLQPLELLLQLGADGRITNNEGKTPLALAMQEQNVTYANQRITEALRASRDVQRSSYRKHR